MSLRNPVFPYSRWTAELPRLKQIYRQNEPFPCIMLDQFLMPEAADQAVVEFPDVESETWIHYLHVNEKKYGKTDLLSFGPTLRTIIAELNSASFLQFLSDLSGIECLFADPSLEGGGLHQSTRGGFLNIHADFTVHPHHRNWRRRMNVLIYLNKDWSPSWGGHLELWDKKMKRRVRKIPPLFNRCVIFNTDPDAFHGHPRPLVCPVNTTRKSIALYYFTREVNPLVRSTEYKARPNDWAKSPFILADKWILRLYDAFKRKTGISDRFASNILKRLNGNKE
jgi:hypothetical protein